VLPAWRKQQKEERLEWGKAWVKPVKVFTRENGEALHPEAVWRLFARLAPAAGLPPIRLHDLRHGAATLMLAGGAEMKLVQAVLRHSSITITSDTYTSVLPDVASTTISLRN
jgi:integrase